MPDPRALAAALVVILVGALVFRLVAARDPGLRRWANLASLVLLLVLVAIIGFVVVSVVSSLGDALRR